LWMNCIFQTPCNSEYSILMTKRSAAFGHREGRLNATSAPSAFTSMTHTHPFLTEEQHAKLVTFAKIMRERGEMTALHNDGEILLHMAMNSVPKPKVQAGDQHSVIMFSDSEWAWMVVMYQGFAEEGGNGLGALKVKREYLMKEFCPCGNYSPTRAKKIFDGMLCILQVDPRTVEYDLRQWNQKQN